MEYSLGLNQPHSSSLGREKTLVLEAHHLFELLHEILGVLPALSVYAVKHGGLVAVLGDRSRVVPDFVFFD